MYIFPGKYFITGITGFVGSLITKYLLNSAEYHAGNIRIDGLIRNEEKAKEIYINYDKKNLYFIKGDLEHLLESTKDLEAIDYIIHCAATTNSYEMIHHPVETISGIVLGTQNILELSRKYCVKSVVYLSSMEVYGYINSTNEIIAEDEQGDLEILSVRSCYPLGKRMAENLCFSFYKEYAVPVKIARLAQTFGSGVLKGENRVFAQFARCVLNGENIILHTEGNSVGNYVESDDAVRALMLLLYSGLDGEAYNIVNECATMTILEMAQFVAKEIAKGKIQVVFDIPEKNIYGYPPATGLRLSAEKIRKLGWRPQYGMEEMYRRMLYDMSR